MVQVIYEEHPYNPVYNDELTRILQNLEDKIRSVEKNHKIILVYNGKKYPKELACAIKSTTVVFISSYELRRF